jgi:hypothetical protein
MADTLPVGGVLILFHYQKCALLTVHFMCNIINLSDTIERYYQNDRRCLYDLWVCEDKHI